MTESNRLIADHSNDSARSLNPITKLIAEIEKERDSVAVVYTPSAPYNWCLEAIKRNLMGDTSIREDDGRNVTISPANLRQGEISVIEGIQEILNKHYVYNKLSGSRFFNIDDATQDLLTLFSERLLKFRKPEPVSLVDCAKAIQRDFPVVSTGADESRKWCARPLDIEVFKRSAKAVLDAAGVRYE